MKAVLGLPIWRLDYLLIALAALLPFEHHGTLHIGATTVRLSQLVVAAIIVTGAIKLVRSKKLPNVALFWPLGLLLLSLVITALQYNYPPIWRGTIIIGALCVFVYVVAINLKEKHLGSIYKTLLITGAATSLFGLYQYVGDALGLSQSLTGLRDQYVKEILGYPRIHSVAFEPMYYANFLLIPLFLIFGRWWAKIKLHRMELIAAALMTLTLILTMSRGAILAAIITILLAIAILRIRIRLSRKAVASIAGIVTAAVGFIFVASFATGQSGLERYSRLFSVDLIKTGSFTERSELRDKAIAVWQASPITGVGIEGVGPYINNHPQPYTDLYYIALHNHLLELLAQTGIIGVIGYYGFIGLLLFRAYQLIKSSTIPTQNKAWLMGFSAALIAIHIQAQAFSGFFLTHIWFVLALLLGVILLTTPKSATIKA